MTDGTFIAVVPAFRLTGSKITVPHSQSRVPQSHFLPARVPLVDYVSNCAHTTTPEVGQLVEGESGRVKHFGEQALLQVRQANSIVILAVLSLLLGREYHVLLVVEMHFGYQSYHIAPRKVPPMISVPGWAGE